MKRIAVILLVITFLFTIFTGCQPGNHIFVAPDDDMGRTVTFDKVPQRLVSHVPSITEMLFALGMGDKVVGGETIIATFE